MNVVALLLVASALTLVDSAFDRPKSARTSKTPTTVRPSSAQTPRYQNVGSTRNGLPVRARKLDALNTAETASGETKTNVGLLPNPPVLPEPPVPTESAWRSGSYANPDPPPIPPREGGKVSVVSSAMSNSGETSETTLGSSRSSPALGQVAGTTRRPATPRGSSGPGWDFSTSISAVTSRKDGGVQLPEKKIDKNENDTTRRDAFVEELKIIASGIENRVAFIDNMKKNAIVMLKSPKVRAALSAYDAPRPEVEPLDDTPVRERLNPKKDDWGGWYLPKHLIRHILNSMRPKDNGEVITVKELYDRLHENPNLHRFPFVAIDINDAELIADRLITLALNYTNAVINNYPPKEGSTSGVKLYSLLMASFSSVLMDYIPYASEREVRYAIDKLKHSDSELGNFRRFCNYNEVEGKSQWNVILAASPSVIIKFGNGFQNAIIPLLQLLKALSACKSGATDFYTEVGMDAFISSKTKRFILEKVPDEYALTPAPMDVEIPETNPEEKLIASKTTAIYHALQYYYLLMELGREVTEASSRIFLQAALADLVALLAEHAVAISQAQRDTDALIAITMDELRLTLTEKPERPKR